MKFRKLRITWSVFWGLACVLLAVFWVRSYWRWDIVAKGWGVTPKECVLLDSHSGAVSILYTDARTDATITFVRWKITTLSSPKADTFFPIGGENETYAGFLFQHLSDGLYLSLPYWFLAPVTAFCAWLPWLKWRGRFSLRTLLLATTLVAVVLGLAIYAASK